ncbi:MAG: peptidyl-prolyl cis-trans isomerase [Gemmatimonadota bacterium]|jgi:hypothetical protein|nr:peptidyl-prolyl cis-trans isomerase [Gemmatimonadota bacterium]
MTSISGTGDRWSGSNLRRGIAAAALLAIAGCDQFSQAMTSHKDILAKAGGADLRVREAAEMLAANDQVPADPEVARAIAELWVDYQLLSTAVAEDSTLAAVDIGFFIAPAREQILIGTLRDRVISVDTIFTDAQIAAHWAEEGPGAEIRARHILLQTPANVTPAQRDSIRALAESIRARAAGGESFAQLATTYSQDPGSAQAGGDLGFFGRGRMVQPFEEAAFALEPGQISPVVESPFGYHIIRVEERRQSEVGDEKEPFRQYLIQKAVQQAELVYLDSMSTAAKLTVNAEAKTITREIAGQPSRSLSGRQGTREIATWNGGSYTAADFQRFIRAQPPEVQTAYATATDEQLDAGIEQLIQMQILLKEAERQGIVMNAEDEAQMRAEAQAMISELVTSTGFIEGARAKATQAQRDEHVKLLVQDVVTGQQPFIPLGRLGIALRELYGYEINEEAFPSVITELEGIRAQTPARAPAGQ